MRHRWLIVAVGVCAIVGGMAVHARNVTISHLQSEGTLLQQLGYEYQTAAADLEDISAAPGTKATRPPSAAANDLVALAKQMRRTDQGLANVPDGASALALCHELRSALSKAGELVVRQSARARYLPSSERLNARHLANLLSGLGGFFFGVSEPLLKGENPPSRYWSQAMGALKAAVSMATHFQAP